MLTVNTNTLYLVDIHQEGDVDHAKLRVNFPLNKAAGTDDSAVVYFEIEPGNYLPTHTDSPEETLFIVAGTGEAHAGDERGIVSAGDLVVIPAMVPHGIKNIGDETLKVVGFFSEAEVESTFERDLQPLGTRVTQMAPVPAPVEA